MKKGSFLLLLTSFIWGMAFVAQKVVTVGPWTLNFLRALLASGALCLILLVSRRRTDPDAAEGSNKLRNSLRSTLVGGSLSGLFLAAASMLQQCGIMRTSVGKASFITTLYVIFVPILGLFFHKKVPAQIWLCVVLAATGLYFLCMEGGFYLETGDLFVLLSAILYAGQLLCIDYYSEGTSALTFSLIQFITMAVFCLIGMLIFEPWSADKVRESALAVLYVGILSSGAGGTLQVAGQRDTDPTVASLLLSLESVFAAIGGFVLLGQSLSGREVFGCTLTFSAVVLAQLPLEKWLRRAGGSSPAG